LPFYFFYNCKAQCPGSNEITSLRYAAKDGIIYRPNKVQEVWGIVGSATPNGWDGPDIKFVKMADKSWQLKNVKLESGEVKFRLNDDWSINLGKGLIDTTLEFGSGNIKVNSGIYDIILSTDNKTMPSIKWNKVN
jgi:starch-binding outer membrane protein SusE/F